MPKTPENGQKRDRPTLPDIPSVQAKLVRRKGRDGRIRIVKERPRAPYAVASLISKHECSIKTLLDPTRAKEKAASLNDLDMRERKARGSLLKLTELTGESPAEIMRRLRLTEDEIARMGKFHATVQWHVGPATGNNPWD